MPNDNAFNGLPVEVSDNQANLWKARLAQAVLAILVVGFVLTAILWSAVNSDVGALTLSVVFTLCAGLMVIRQALVAERP